TQWASWHWIFLVNLPLGGLVLLAAIFTVDETKGEKQRRGADVDGALLSAIGFGALVFAIIEGPKLGWWTPTSEMVVFGWTWPTTAALSRVIRSRIVCLRKLTVGAGGCWGVRNHPRTPAVCSERTGFACNELGMGTCRHGERRFCCWGRCQTCCRPVWRTRHRPGGSWC